MPDTSILDRICELSRFDDDSAAALRSLHTHFAHTLDQCSVALVLVRGLPFGLCRLAGSIAPDGREHVPNTDPFGVAAELPLFDDAVANRLLADINPRRIQLTAAEQTLPFPQALFGATTLLGIPTVNNGEVAHWVIFGSANPEQFALVDLDKLLIEVNLAASLLVRPLSTRALRDESARQRQAIEGLADVQKQLLPDDPKILGLSYAIHWQPADTAAGDYYDMANLTHRAPADFQRDKHDVWVVTLADVSGHGAAAAMEAVQFDAIMRTYKGSEEAGPAGALTYANRHFFSRRIRHHFLTAVAVLYRPDIRRATYVSAGHPPILHRQGNAVIEHGAETQIPLGVLRDHEWVNHQFELALGDILVLYTDGIIEARNGRGEPFGTERLKSLVAAGPSDPRLLLVSLRTALFEYQGGEIGSDDQTLIVFRITA
ncbi:PP2C family protein-serine/threonine phosphatase [Dokdonella sp.]|uniref:PP2C family protein-serine/threonine phosphatase n=1 Tax=Dokdonella sp. TaxID=2291710 RepID=UPI003527727D